MEKCTSGIYTSSCLPVLICNFLYSNSNFVYLKYEFDIVIIIIRYTHGQGKGQRKMLASYIDALLTTDFAVDNILC